MCTPVLAAVIGGGQAVLGHMGQVQAATQRNKNRAALYNAEKVKVEHQHQINIQNYYLRGVDAEDTWDETALESSLARQKQEVLLNEAVAAAFQGMEGDYIKLQSDQRIGRYAEMSGVTARRGRTALKSAIGRSQASRLAAVDLQRDRALATLQEIRVTKDKADREARDMIGMEPERGPGPVKPKWDKGPSMLSLIVKTALGAYSGYKMGKALQGAKPGSVDPFNIDLGIAEKIPGLDLTKDIGLGKGFTSAATTFNQKTLVGVGASQVRTTHAYLPNNFYDFIPLDTPVYSGFNDWFTGSSTEASSFGLNIGVKK